MNKSFDGSLTKALLPISQSAYDFYYFIILRGNLGSRGTGEKSWTPQDADGIVERFVPTDTPTNKKI